MSVEIIDPNSKAEFVRRRASLRLVGETAVAPTAIIVAGDGSLFGTYFENAAVLHELQATLRAERDGELEPEIVAERLARIGERLK